MPCMEDVFVNVKVYTDDVFMVCSHDETPPSKLFMYIVYNCD